MTRFSIAYVLLGALWLLSQTGCSGLDNFSVDSALKQDPNIGVITLDLSTIKPKLVVNSALIRLAITAQFVKSQASDTEAVGRLLAFPLSPDRDLPMTDFCQLYDLSLMPAASKTENYYANERIELVDAGILKIQTSDHAIQLESKHFPELIPLLSGVIYRGVEDISLTETARLTVTSSGSDEVGPLLANMVAPSIPELHWVGSQAIGTIPMDSLAVQSSRSLLIEWQSSSSPSGEVLYLAGNFFRDQKEWELRCKLEDDGEFSLPAVWLQQLPSHILLELVRIKETSFNASGLLHGRA